MTEQDLLQGMVERINLYKTKPNIFVREIITAEPEPWQDDELATLPFDKWHAIKSGQGAGKTTYDAWVICWWLGCFWESRVLCTAPTEQQLTDQLWPECYKWIQKSPVLSKLMIWQKTQISMAARPETWNAVYKTATKAENLQGYHANRLLVLAEEASGISDKIMEVLHGTLSGTENKLLMTGNPTKSSGSFYDAFNLNRALYHTRTVSSREVSRTDKTNIVALERKYGKDSNVVRVRVDGLFPNAEDDVFIPLYMIERALMQKNLLRPPVTHLRVACDVARFGGDKTVIGWRANELTGFYDKRIGQDTMTTAAKIIYLANKLRAIYKYTGIIPALVDDSGVGGGVTDRLRQIKREEPGKYSWLYVQPVIFGKPINNIHYADSTTFMMAQLKDQIDTRDAEGNDRMPSLYLPKDDDLIAQLSCRKYRLTDKSKIKVESKEEMKKRDLPSPDEADCMLLLALKLNPEVLAKQGTRSAAPMKEGEAVG